MFALIWVALVMVSPYSNVTLRQFYYTILSIIVILTVVERTLMEFYDIFFPIRSGLCLDTKFSKFNYIVVLQNQPIFKEWLHLWVCSYLSMNNVPYCIQTTYLFIYESWDLWVLLLSAVMNNASMTLCVYPCVYPCVKKWVYQCGEDCAYESVYESRYK